MLRHAPSAIIHLDHLRHNLVVAQRFASKRSLFAVVKADAYGHGLSQVVDVFANHPKTPAEGFAVARLEEALAVREQLNAPSSPSRPVLPVLLLGGVYSDEQLKQCLEQHIDLVVHSMEQVELLCAHKPANSNSLTIWLKLDSGMHRLGLSPETFRNSFERISALPYINQVVAMSHFASADEVDNTNTTTQFEQFDKVISRLPSPPETSLANSATLCHWPDYYGDRVRPGLMLYGINPTPHIVQDLKPAMTLQAPIIAIRNVKAGERVGYNETWQAPRNSVIATAALGYGDGYPTTLLENTPVLINGQRAFIVGRVSMDLITIDCTGFNVAIGDSAIFWGEDSKGEKLAVEEIARQAQTIPYDLVTKVTGRVTRLYQ